MFAAGGLGPSHDLLGTDQQEWCKSPPGFALLLDLIWSCLLVPVAGSAVWLDKQLQSCCFGTNNIIVEKNARLLPEPVEPASQMGTNHVQVHIGFRLCRSTTDGQVQQPMCRRQRSADDGVWRIRGPSSWYGEPCGCRNETGSGLVKNT